MFRPEALRFLCLLTQEQTTSGAAAADPRVLVSLVVGRFRETRDGQKPGRGKGIRILRFSNACQWCVTIRGWRRHARLVFRRIQTYLQPRGGKRPDLDRAPVARATREHRTDTQITKAIAGVECTK